MKPITPFLWFDDQAEEAALFYTSIFANSRVGNITRYGEAGPGSSGTVMTVSFEINGMEFVALNGGPVFSFSPAISFVVNCESQEEVDEYWEKLLEGGKEQQCGWLTDKFGVTWQIVPVELYDLVNGPDPAGAIRATEAMLKMVKLDVEVLRAAYHAKKT